MNHARVRSECDLETPKRNRYFFGQMLDVDHFQRIDAYGNGKRWMLNRLISGLGVVCGLDVRFGPDRRSVIITPGFAIDRHGREIIVGCETAPVPIPPHLLVGESAVETAAGKPVGTASEPAPGTRRSVPLHVLICYHECEADPAPVHASGCHAEGPCQPGSIEERFRILFRPGCLPQPTLAPRIPGLFRAGCKPALDYGVLAKWVSRKCPECPRDACLPLANLFVRLDPDEPLCGPEIDVTVRPICLTHDLLMQIFLGLVAEQPDHWGEK